MEKSRSTIKTTSDRRNTLTAFIHKKSCFLQ
uniref:Uncharacterized protein n=1 Tax=Caudovirales sp. ct2A51 TaxID=2827630 RepID=A0A8S5T094_9CAUD|nr:MAG TPA: hypothetical protein [Caudovirales sp. ct2A51]